jgi:hypothetical protein
MPFVFLEANKNKICCFRFLKTLFSLRIRPAIPVFLSPHWLSIHRIAPLVLRQCGVILSLHGASAECVKNLH